MNNPFVLRQAKYVAERVQRDVGADSGECSVRAYLLVFGRPPNEREKQRAITHIAEHGLTSFCWALINASEFLYVK
jgi:hypothetical protein